MDDNCVLNIKLGSDSWLFRVLVPKDCLTKVYPTRVILTSHYIEGKGTRIKNLRTPIPTLGSTGVWRTRVPEVLSRERPEANLGERPPLRNRNRLETKRKDDLKIYKPIDHLSVLNVNFQICENMLSFSSIFSLNSSTLPKWLLTINQMTVTQNRRREGWWYCTCEKRKSFIKRLKLDIVSK